MATGRFLWSPMTGPHQPIESDKNGGTGAFLCGAHHLERIIGKAVRHQRSRCSLLLIGREGALGERALTNGKP